MVDSDDLPLVISRVTLQQSNILRVFKKNLVMVCLELFAGIAEKKGDYKKFCELVGTCLKPGVHEDSTNRAKVAELLRFITSKSGEEQVSLKGCIAPMKEGLNGICYFAGESITKGFSPPFLGTLQKKGLEVRCLVSPGRRVFACSC